MNNRLQKSESTITFDFDPATLPSEDRAKLSVALVADYARAQAAMDGLELADDFDQQVADLEAYLMEPVPLDSVLPDLSVIRHPAIGRADIEGREA